jgi:hypothetical protein
MNSRRRKNGTSKSLYRSKKTNSNVHKNHAQASGSARVSHSSSKQIEAQREEEEESSQRSSQEEDEDQNKDDDEEKTSSDENSRDTSSSESSDSESNDEPEERSGLIIRIPLGMKRRAPISDKARTDKEKYVHIYTYMLLIYCVGAKIPRRASPLPVEENQEPAVVAHEITYNLSIFSLEQLQKSTRSREAVARFVRLSSDLTWDDVF